MMSKTTKLAFLGIISALLISFFLVTQTAHAGFREALDAYQERDGKAMLAAVKDAVEKKDDDGLFLFISSLGLDRAQSQKFDLFNKKRGKHIEKEPNSVVENILTPAQLKVLFKLLRISVQNQDLKTQYQFESVRLLFQKNHDKYNSKDYIQSITPLAEKGFPQAALDVYYYHVINNRANKVFNKKNQELALLKHAALSDSLQAKYILGLQYLNIDYGGAEDYKNFGPKKNAILGCDWMQQVANDANPWSINIVEFAYFYSELLKSKRCKPSDDNHELVADDWRMLSMNIENKKLNKLIAKKIDSNILLSFKRTRGVNAESPFDAPYFIDIYKDGKVTMLLGSNSNDLNNEMIVTRLPEKRISYLFKVLKALNIDSWPSFYESQTGYQESFNTYNYYVIFDDGNRLIYKMFKSPDRWLNTNASTQEKQMAKLLVTLEEMVPTKGIRCELSSSKKYKENCHKHETEIIQTSKLLRVGEDND